MSKAQVVTAWRVRDGRVVYLDASLEWVEALDRAQLLEGEALDAALAWARAPERERAIVDPYAFPVSPERRPTGRRARETIRASGPTIRPLVTLPSEGRDT